MKMDMRGIQESIGDPEIAKMLDNIFDAVMALKARLADSNRDSNSLGGILIPPTSLYNVPDRSSPEIFQN
jgi:hypothetical protein